MGWGFKVTRNPEFRVYGLRFIGWSRIVFEELFKGCLKALCVFLHKVCHGVQ